MLFKNPGITFCGDTRAGPGYWRNTAIFSVVNRCCLRPLPMTRLTVWCSYPKPQVMPEILSLIQTSVIGETRIMYSKKMASTTGAVHLTGSGEAERIITGQVRLICFLLCCQTLLLDACSRTKKISLAEHRLFLLSYGFMASRFGGQSSI